MSSVVRPSTPRDEAQIIELLSRAFSVDPGAHFLEPALVRWKYWEPRADCPESRSLVVEKEGRIVAHVGLWPVTLGTGERSERGVHMIDWASEAQAPGSGLSLLQRLTKSYDFIYCVGGTQMTQSILPRFGFRTVAEAVTWGRPLRPLRQMLRHQKSYFRSPGRFARKAWWSLSPPRAAGPGWAAVPSPSGGIDDRVDSAVPACERGEAFFAYLRHCPAIRCLTFHLMREGRKTGWLALAVGRVQTRVAGIWLENPSPANWRTAFLLAQRAAVRYTDTFEIIARCSTEASAAGAEQAGMRMGRRAPVFLLRNCDREKSLLLECQLCDDDAFFLGSQLVRFAT
jgi:hypothetical protein